MPSEDTLIALGEIKGKLDALHELVGAKLDSHEQRIRSTEQSRWIDRGVFGTLSALLLYRFH